MKSLKSLMLVFACFASCGCAWSRVWETPSNHMAQAVNRMVEIKEAEARGYDIRPFYEGMDRFTRERDARLSSTK
jgi:hypothetical protein